jgi:hypothetical protein
MSARSDHLRRRRATCRRSTASSWRSTKIFRVLGDGVDPVGPDQLDDQSDKSIEGAERHGAAASSSALSVVKRCDRVIAPFRRVFLPLLTVLEEPPDLRAGLSEGEPVQTSSTSSGTPILARFSSSSWNLAKTTSISLHFRCGTFLM